MMLEAETREGLARLRIRVRVNPLSFFCLLLRRHGGPLWLREEAARTPEDVIFPPPPAGARSINGVTPPRPPRRALCLPALKLCPTPGNNSAGLIRRRGRLENKRINSPLIVNGEHLKTIQCANYADSITV